MSRSAFSAHFLATSGLPVKTIAGKIGYRGRGNFSRAVKAGYGVDPAGHRQGAGRGAERPPAGPGAWAGAGFGSLVRHLEGGEEGGLGDLDVADPAHALLGIDSQWTPASALDGYKVHFSRRGFRRATRGASFGAGRSGRRRRWNEGDNP